MFPAEVGIVHGGKQDGESLKVALAVIVERPYAASLLKNGSTPGYRSKRQTILHSGRAAIMATADEAKLCAESSPVGMFGIDDLMLAISVIELGFKLWQACSRSSSASDATKAAQITATTPINFRQARRHVNRAARSKGIELSTENLNGLTAHMLNHVVKADEQTLSACCAEPVIEDESDDA